MISEKGKELKESNERIVQCISHLKEQRDEIAYLIDKQYDERKKLETEMERITYKLCLINKSLAQRERAKNNYDRTLTEIEQKYFELVKNSGDLLGVVQKEYDELDSIINKKTNTEVTQMGEEETETSSYCMPHETHCICEGRKDSKTRKIYKALQTKVIDVEEPIKLEKVDEISSMVGSNRDSGAGSIQDSMGGFNRDSLGDTPETKETEKQDNELDEDPNSTLEYRRYS